jgi:hypothetical protein
MVDSEDPRNEITPEASSLLQILSDSIESSEASPRHLFLFETLFVGIGAVRSLRTPEVRYGGYGQVAFCANAHL